MWMNNFVDVLAVVFTNIWFWVGVIVLSAVAVIFANTRMDENDRKLERMEVERRNRLEERLQRSLEEEPKDRMVRLTTPHESREPHFLEALLDHYQLSLEANGDADTMTLVDRKFFELRNKRVSVDRWNLMGANKDEARKILSAARSTINRRAERAGLRTTNASRGRYAKRAAA